MNEQEEREMCPRKWVGKPLPDDCPELQKKAKKSRENGEDEEGSRGEAEQEPIRRKGSREGKVETARAREQKDP